VLVMVTENYVEHPAVRVVVVAAVMRIVVMMVVMICAHSICICYTIKGNKEGVSYPTTLFFDAIHVSGKTLADQTSNFLSHITAANPNPKYGQDCLQKFKGYL
jgi:hypothetical protein